MNHILWLSASYIVVGASAIVIDATDIDDGASLIVIGASHIMVERIISVVSPYSRCLSFVLGSD